MNCNTRGRLGQQVDDLIPEFVGKWAVLIKRFRLFGLEYLDVP